jgi:hypothetical protein
LPDMIDHSKIHTKILQPQQQKYDVACKQLKRQILKQSALLLRTRTITELRDFYISLRSKTLSLEVRILGEDGKPGQSIGGNEMVLQEMIEQSKIKKGYVPKTELMRINLMNLTLVAGGNPEDLLPVHKKIAVKTKTDKKPPEPTKLNIEENYSSDGEHHNDG